MTDEPRIEEELEEIVEEPAAEPAPDDSYLRLAADFDNYRKRVAREHAELTRRANERLMSELIVVLDGLERALDAAEKHEEAQLEEGVKLIHRLLDEILRRHGLRDIETDGEFDPHVHEAVLTRPSDERENFVLEVLQKGYRIGDQVLRPAAVIVAQR